MTEKYPCPICNLGRAKEKPKIMHAVIEAFTADGKHYANSIICDKEENQNPPLYRRIAIGY